MAVVAYSGTYTVTGVYDGTWQGHLSDGSGMRDGLNTPASGWFSPWGTHHIQADLGATYDVTEISIMPTNWGAGWTDTGTIWHSTDGTNFTLLENVSGTVDGQLKTYDYSGAPVSARYLRFAATSNYTGTSEFRISYDDGVPTGTVEGDGLLDDLISYYKCDEPNSSDGLLDAHGTNDFWQQHFPPKLDVGVINSGRNFPDTTDYFGLGTIPGLSLTGDWTISLWVKFNGLAGTGWQGIIYKGTGEEIAITRYGNYWRTYIGGSSTWHSETHNIGQWYHLVYRYDSATSIPTFSVDGIHVDESTKTHTQTNDSWIIGKTFGGAPIIGSIDEIGIWSRRLTDNQVYSLHNGGSGYAYSNFLSSGAAVSSYTFNALMARDLNGTAIGTHTFNNLVSQSVGGGAVNTKTFNNFLTENI